MDGHERVCTIACRTDVLKKVKYICLKVQTNNSELNAGDEGEKLKIRGACSREIVRLRYKIFKAWGQNVYIYKTSRRIYRVE